MPIRTVVALVALASSALGFAPQASLLQQEGAALANGLWHFEDFLSPVQIAFFLAKAHDASVAWLPCEGSAHAIEKRCAILSVRDEDKPALDFLDKLGRLWGVNMTHMHRGLPIVWTPPGSSATKPHVDVYTGGQAEVFDVSTVVYLTNVPTNTSRNVFDELGVAVQPSAGAVLTWRNTDANGWIRDEAVHHVEALPEHAEARLAMQIPITLTKPFSLKDDGSTLSATEDSRAAPRCALPLFVGAGSRNNKRALWHTMWQPHASPSPDNTGLGASGDPHLHLAHGGKADVRGEDGGIYSMLSAKDLNMNIEMASADFRWSQRLIHGTKMKAAYWTVRTNASSTLLTVEFSDSTAALGPKNHAIAHIGVKNFTIHAGHPFRMGNVAVSVIGSGVTVTTDNHWEMSANLASFPFESLNSGQKLINVKAKALYDADNDNVAPHGLFGQSYDGDEVAVDGAVDARNQKEMTTKAQAEGAIEGVLAHYKMADKFATKFKYSRFDATSAPHRDVTKLTGLKHAAKKPIAVVATDVDEEEATSVASSV